MAETIPFPDWKARIQRGNNNAPIRNLTNLVLHLRGIPKLGRNLRFNELTQMPEWNGAQISDADLLDIRLIVEAEGFQPMVTDMKGAVERVARESSYDPVKDYLDGLKWDKRARLGQWTTRLLGAEDTPFNRIAGRKTLIAAVARAYQPGCKVDTILILEGPQGAKKSSAIAALFGKEYTAESVSLFDKHKEMVMQMFGAWCVELAEFVAFLKKDEATVKGLITMRSDRVVLPYAQTASDHPRRCIFFGTINPSDMGYLSDSTGNRRYWPVAVGNIDMAGIIANRDQLWAEAVQAYKNGEAWWLDGEEEKYAEAIQQERMIEDPWGDILTNKLMGRDDITTDVALTELGIPYERRGKREQMRVATVLKSIGYARVKVREGEKTSWKWRLNMGP